MSATTPSRDRRQLLLGAGATLNGIDYVNVAGDQLQLSVHFLNAVEVAGTLSGSTPVTITGGEVIDTVAVTSTAFTSDGAGRPILTLTVAAPGDFSTYQLAVTSAALDPFFASVEFSFKAGCPTEADCRPPATSCSEPRPEPVTIDYLAKDFTSFTQALSEFSATRYPGWLERSEADLGVVLMEALAALADELSYLQDRVAGEASIVTATQRLSVLRHARLVDYEPAPTTVAAAVLQLEVGAPGPITTPVRCSAIGADGSTIEFEVGAGLADPATGALRRISCPVDPRWNRFVYTSGVAGALNLAAYWWDDSQICLAAGATTLWVVGHGHGFYPGQQLLLDTAAPDSADPPVREVVTLSSATGAVPIESIDSLLGTELTELTLAAPTAVAHDLSATEVAGNLVTVTQGARAIDTFYIPPGDAPAQQPAATPAVVRIGANWTPADPLPDYRHCLAGDPLAWLTVDPDRPLPTVTDGQMTAGEATLTSATAQFAATDVGTTVTVLGAGPAAGALSAGIVGMTNAKTVTLGISAATTVSAAPVVLGTAAIEDDDVTIGATPELVLTGSVRNDPPSTWQHVRWLLDAAPSAMAFTLTPERYTAVLTSGTTTFYDYDGDDGTTIRFGDGVFGAIPVPQCLFSATYRVGGGAIGNVPADTIVTVAAGQQQGDLILRCTNPFPASGGADAETITQVAQRAPHQFAKPLTVVAPADYVAGAQSLAFVQQAGTTMRWTGSWMTAFTSADPAGAEQPDAAQLQALTQLLDRRRLAGCESYVLPPRYASIDLVVVVLAQPTVFAASVQSSVLARLRPGPLAGDGVGFFDHSQWGFGMPLAGSALLAAIQSCAGVAGVLWVGYRRRGAQLQWIALPGVISVAPDQILRLDDDPSRPDAGLLSVTVEGGK